MTPEEKAKEIFDYYFVQSENFFREEIKKMSLFCVSQIIVALKTCGDFNYWFQVKEEIEKL